MTLAADILSALDGAGCSCAAQTMALAVRQPQAAVDDMLERLVTGCYIVREGGLYRRSTADERAKWMLDEGTR